MSERMNQVISSLTNEQNQLQQQQKEHTHYAKISENAKGEPSVTVSVSADDRYEVHDEIMSLYQMVKESLVMIAVTSKGGAKE